MTVNWSIFDENWKYQSAWSNFQKKTFEDCCDVSLLSDYRTKILTESCNAYFMLEGYLTFENEEDLVNFLLKWS